MPDTDQLEESQEVDRLEQLQDVFEAIREYSEELPAGVTVTAERAMINAIKEQIAGGATDIDLSTHYLTDDVALAQIRHDKALENIAPIIQQLEEIDGYSVSAGQAIAVNLKHAETERIKPEEALKKSEEYVQRHSQKLSIGM